jgi:hypothetical protein
VATRRRHGTWGGRLEFADRRQPCRLWPLLCFAAPEQVPAPAKPGGVRTLYQSAPQLMLCFQPALSSGSCTSPQCAAVARHAEVGYGLANPGSSLRMPVIMKFTPIAATMRAITRVMTLMPVAGTTQHPMDRRSHP